MNYQWNYSFESAFILEKQIIVRSSFQKVCQLWATTYSFLTAGPCLWSDIPDYIRDTPSLQKSLKTYLFENYFY